MLFYTEMREREKHECEKKSEIKERKKENAREQRVAKRKEEVKKREKEEKTGQAGTRKVLMRNLRVFFFSSTK